MLGLEVWLMMKAAARGLSLLSVGLVPIVSLRPYLVPNCYPPVSLSDLLLREFTVNVVIFAPFWVLCLWLPIVFPQCLSRTVVASEMV